MVVNRCVPVMLFSNQKVFLDVKDYSRLDQLEADIRQFGGIIEKFLSKEITCVVTNRGRAENFSQQKDVSVSTCSQSQSVRPSASGNRVLSRGQSLLMRSNSLKDTSVCDPVSFAQMWGIETVTLDTVLQAIERQLPTCTPSSPASNRSTKSYNKKRKFSGASVKFEDTESTSRPFLTKFAGAFVKFEDMQCNFRPFFHQYSSFPHLDLESDLSNGVFRCDKNIRPVAATKKNAVTTPNTRKQKAWSKRGYCECCDTMYDDLNQHLVSSGHQRFVQHVENFADLDKLIDQIPSSDGNVTLLRSKDNCMHHVPSETLITEYTKETQLCSNNSPSSAAAEPAPSHNVHPKPNQPPDHQSEAEEPDKPVSAIDNNVSVEQTCDETTAHDSVNSVNMLPAKLANNCTDVDSGNEVTDKLQSQRLPDHWNHDTILSISATVPQSIDSHKTDLCKEKLCKISDDGNISCADDTSDLIPSNYVLNVLEFLSNENCANSTLHAKEAGEIYEDSTSITPGNSGAVPCIPASCCYGAGHAELLLHEKDCRQTSVSCVVDKLCSPVISAETDVLGQFDSAVVMEQHSTNTDKCTTNSGHASKSVMLTDSSALTSANVIAPSETLLSTSISMADNDANNNMNMKVNDGASALPLLDVNNDCYILPASLSVDQPAVCSADTTAKSTGPVYAQSHVNSVCTYADSPVPSSDSVNDSCDLHDKLLTMAYGPSTVEHDKWQNCSSVHASYPVTAECVDFSTSSNNNVCLSLALGLPLCLFEGSVASADCSDAGLCTPVHSHEDSFEKPSTSTGNGTLTELTSHCQSSPCSGIIPCIGSSYVNDSSQSSLPCTGWQMNINDVNITSDKQRDECLVQEKGDSEVNLYPCTGKSFEAEIKCDETVKCTSLHASDDADRSVPAATVQIETTLVDNSSCCTKSFSNLSGSHMSGLSVLSPHPENNNLSVTEVPECCDITEPVVEVDVGNDSASTLVYSCEHINSSVLEQTPDVNKSETTVDCREPSVSSASSMWKVISFVDCRMRLIRTEAGLSTRDSNEVNNMLAVSEPESNDVTEPVQQVDTNSMSTAVYGCDSRALSVQEQMKTKTEITGDHTELPVSNSGSTWKVMSFADCRMRLVRTKAIIPSPSARTVSSDSRHWYTQNYSCNVGLNFFLSQTADKVLSC